MVADNESGKSIESEVRTSSGMFLNKAQDISDYDDARYGCSGADICLDCWPLMTVAIKVVDTALRGCLGVRFRTDYLLFSI